MQGIFININWKKKPLKDLEQLKISANLMKSGIVFVWSHKPFLSKIIEIMNSKQFKYVENICIARVDANCLHAAGKKNTKAAISDLQDTKQYFLENMADSEKDPSDCFLYDEKNQYIRSCKMILLMFYRVVPVISRIKIAKKS